MACAAALHACLHACACADCRRYFSQDYETGLLIHTAKSVAMMGAIMLAFVYTSYMYIAGTNTPKPAAAATQG